MSTETTPLNGRKPESGYSPFSIGAIVASAGSFIFGAYSIYSSFAHGRPFDGVKIAASIATTFGPAICTGACCYANRQSTSSREMNDATSNLEAGKNATDPLIQTLQKVNVIFSRYPRNDGSTATLPLQDPDQALGQLPTVVESLLKDLLSRAQGSDQELSTLKGQLKDNAAALAALQSTNEQQTSTIASLQAAAVDKVTFKKEILQLVLKPAVEEINAILTNAKFQTEGFAVQTVSLEDLEKAISEQPKLMESLLNRLLSKATTAEETVKARDARIAELHGLLQKDQAARAASILTGLDDSTSSAYSTGASAPASPQRTPSASPIVSPAVLSSPAPASPAPASPAPLTPTAAVASAPPRSSGLRHEGQTES